MRRSIGKIFMALGVICILGAFGLLGFNSYMNNTAGAMSDKYAVAVKEYIEEHQPIVSASDYLEVEAEEDDDVTMTAVEIDGYYYIGYLSIPAQNMYLPIMEEWDNQRLNIAPCRYSGSSKSDDLVIAGHNYKRHFGPLKKLKNDDEVIFTDMESNTIIYQVVEVEVVEPTDIHEMVTGDWDLTLFTCTYGGQARYALRCTRKILTNTD